jgi:hypothetical protein
VFTPNQHTTYGRPSQSVVPSAPGSAFLMRTAMKCINGINHTPTTPTYGSCNHGPVSQIRPHSATACRRRDTIRSHRRPPAKTHALVVHPMQNSKHLQRCLFLVWHHPNFRLFGGILCDKNEGNNGNIATNIPINTTYVWPHSRRSNRNCPKLSVTVDWMVTPCCCNRTMRLGSDTDLYECPSIDPLNFNAPVTAASVVKR